MSGKRRSSTGSGSGSKKPKNIRDALLRNPDQVHKSLETKYVGKRLLIKSSALYGKGGGPKGERDYLFQYIVTSIDEDGTTATIEFEKKYIENGGTTFKAYPIIDAENDYEMEGYRVALIKEDSQLYDHYRGIYIINRALSCLSLSVCVSVKKI